MPPADDQRGTGDGASEPTRTEIGQIGRALRQEWVLSPLQKKALLSRLYKVVFESKYDRNRIAAAKAIALFMGLNLRQEQIDLVREKLDGGDRSFVLAEIVADAERIALEHKPAERPTSEERK